MRQQAQGARIAVLLTRGQEDRLANVNPVRPVGPGDPIGGGVAVDRELRGVEAKEGLEEAAGGIGQGSRRRERSRQSLITGFLPG
ncbi:hypothetical protein Mrose_02024 [Calidithermus roseus]|uniref:Uncharacterized protein n=1 Tax=Calidithermus roseus TaxID=1644118 RepID=A0A399EQH9_9DEIN|nr:hypothetical protein Mrose_02024 [Calidithermus roseus]